MPSGQLSLQKCVKPPSCVGSPALRDGARDPPAQTPDQALGALMDGNQRYLKAGRPARSS